jgi:hypothetical protein
MAAALVTRGLTRRRWWMWWISALYVESTGGARPDLHAIPCTSRSGEIHASSGSTVEYPLLEDEDTGSKKTARHPEVDALPIIRLLRCALRDSNPQPFDP